MTDLIEVKTANLVGEALGWAVGRVEGLSLQLAEPGYNAVPWRVFARYQGQATAHSKRYNPWEDWTLGGPLIDKHLGSAHHNPHLEDSSCRYSAGPAGAGIWLYGPNALVAFCRTLVLTKLGDTVQVPKELCQ